MGWTGSTLTRYEELSDCNRTEFLIKINKTQNINIKQNMDIPYSKMEDISQNKNAVQHSTWPLQLTYRVHRTQPYVKPRHKMTWWASFDPGSWIWQMRYRLHAPQLHFKPNPWNVTFDAVFPLIHRRHHPSVTTINNKHTQNLRHLINQCMYLNSISSKLYTHRMSTD